MCDHARRNSQPRRWRQMRNRKLDPKLIEQYGAVSAQVADAMARAALDCSQADIAVSVTGVAGPEPDERSNPVGLVYLACARKAGNCVGVKREFGDIGRSRIRYEAAMEALALITSQTEALRYYASLISSARSAPVFQIYTPI